MSFSQRFRKHSLFAIAVAAASFAASNAFANPPPQVAVNGAGGNMQLDSPVTFQGVAKDPQGIKQIYGTIQVNSTKQFVTQKGGLSKDPSRLQFKFTQSTATRWASQSFNLPRGQYTFRIRVEDGAGAISPMIEVPFVATGNAAMANNNAQSQQAREARAAAAAAAAATAAATTNTQAASQPKPAVTTAATGAKAANGLAYCSGANMDSDGDGFGWENNSSCVVTGSKADTHPTCASSASDPDGDGYGWENEKSCIVVSHCASGASDPDGDGFGWENNRSCVVMAKTNNTRFPTCATGAAADPDGDGYGWENNATCAVAK